MLCPWMASFRWLAFPCSACFSIPALLYRNLGSRPWLSVTMATSLLARLLNLVRLTLRSASPTQAFFWYPVLLGQRNLAGCSARGRKESVVAEHVLSIECLQLPLQLADETWHLKLTIQFLTNRSTAPYHFSLERYPFFPPSVASCLFSSSVSVCPAPIVSCHSSSNYFQPHAFLTLISF